MGRDSETPLWAPDPATIYRTNVDGTRTTLEAAGEAGVQRIVYTSTVAVLGLPADGRPGTEETPVSLDDIVSDYERSKFLAERLALDLAGRGLPVVVVNPAVPFGPWDVKPTPTGQMVVDFMRGRAIAAVDTGLNVVHVRALHPRPPKPFSDRALRDPRRDHPAPAATRPRAARDGVARRRLLRGPSPPDQATPGRVLRGRPDGASAAVLQRLPGRARLGLPQIDVQTALADAVAWFDAHGYAARRATSRSG